MKQFRCSVCGKLFRHLYLYVQHLQEESEKEKEFKKGRARFHLSEFDNYWKTQQRQRESRRGRHG